MAYQTDAEGSLSKRPLADVANAASDAVADAAAAEAAAGAAYTAREGRVGEGDDERDKAAKRPKPEANHETGTGEDDENMIFEQANADELEDVVDDYAETGLSPAAATTPSLAQRADAKRESGEGSTNGQEPALATEAPGHQYVPKEPLHPIQVGKNMATGRYKFPLITKDDSLNARSYLKHFGSARFLDAYLPEDLNSLYIYHLIKLLGFQIKDKSLLEAVQKVVENNLHPESVAEPVVRLSPLLEPTPDSEDDNYFDDPLEKRHAVRLIKDLQKAMNKVLSTRIKLANFHTLEHFAAKLKTARRVLVLTGAGISTSLGIPDFRSSEGFYSKIKHLGLDDPQDVFNYDIFMQDPSVFYNIAHMVLPPENLYSPLHSFIKMIQDKSKLLRNYTQNIDNLESYAGIQAEKMVQCHGSFATASCVTCHWKLPGEKIFGNIRRLELPLCPYCYQKRKDQYPTTTDEDVAGTAVATTTTTTTAAAAVAAAAAAAAGGLGAVKAPSAASNPNSVFHMMKSYGVLKPDITFFGEALPSKFHRFIREDVLKCDLLICIGTSLKVAPVSEIVNMVPANVPQVLINKDPVKHAEFDLSLLGFCDDVAALVAQKCGWEIPHDKWAQLEHKAFACEEQDRGVYQVYPRE